MSRVLTTSGSKNKELQTNNTHQFEKLKHYI